MKEINRILNSFKSIVFIDFEGSQYGQEIIAIGAIKVDLDNKNLIKKTYNPFKCYIKIDEDVGDFITNLTGISNELLNKKGLSFNLAIKKLESYVGKDSVKFFHYGNFDVHLLHNSRNKNKLNENEFIARILNNSIDFSKVLSHYVKSEKNTPLSLVDALRIFQTNIDQNLHDPETDAINLMHLYQSFLKKHTILKNEYIKVLKNSPSLANPFKKIIKKLESEQKVTYKDFISYIEEDLK